MLYSIAQKIMMKIDPEKVHDWILGFFHKTGNNLFNWFYTQGVKPDPVVVMGITFPNCVGLAAGLDKDGEAIDAFHKMGFGHIEVGTVTPKPQSGNPKPRMFRVKENQAIINRMGFNNKGVDNLVDNLKAKRSNILVGVNIGKNKDTPVDEGKNDYLICMEKVYPHAAYITVNISSPNTPGLRSLQYGELLNDLLSELKYKQRAMTKSHGRYVPIALKIAPDLSEEEIDSIAASLLANEFDAVIATNTTLDRKKIEGLQHAEESGGLSGCPLRDVSTAVISQLHSKLKDQIPIIGVGGINNAHDAQIKFEAGADLVQIYTGFIYQGPSLIKQIVDNRRT